MENKIKKLREKYGWSRAEFCRKLNIPLRTVENWDNERTSTYPNEWTERLILNGMISLHREIAINEIEKIVLEKTMSFYELDGKMMSLGYDSVLDEVDELLIDSGSISYLLEKRDSKYNDYINIVFDVIEEDEEDTSNSKIKITRIDII